MSSLLELDLFLIQSALEQSTYNSLKLQQKVEIAYLAYCCRLI
jgi:hypothetical protein